ncbi:MAG: hypothetical protein CR997_11820 [Acidobacteria bacterium]|nr:MAG: hypothetical protein CR997_11820 [Acidobacteriota bacterium]
MPKILSVVNQKGGVGKTTTAINLAASLAVLDQKILVIDFDPQGNTSSGLNIDKDDLQYHVYHLLGGMVTWDQVIHQTELKNLQVIPANRDLAAAEVELVHEVGREYILKDMIDETPLDYDYIFIDCPPSLSLLTVNALAASDSLVIPIQAEYYALEGVGDLVRTINQVKKRINSSLQIEGILLTMYSERTNLSNQVYEEVKNYFGDKFYKTVIPRNVRLSEAPSFGKPAMLYDIKSKGAQAYLKLAKEFLNGQKISAG